MLIMSSVYGGSSTTGGLDCMLKACTINVLSYIFNRALGKAMLFDCLLFGEVLK